MSWVLVLSVIQQNRSAPATPAAIHRCCAPGRWRAGLASGRRPVALLAAPLNDLAHGIRMGHATGQGLLDRALQFCRTVVVQQLHQLGGDPRQRIATRAACCSKSPLDGRRIASRSCPPVMARRPFGLHQRGGEVGRVPDLFALAVASGVVGNDLVAIEYAHLVGEASTVTGAAHPGVGKLRSR